MWQFHKNKLPLDVQENYKCTLTSIRLHATQSFFPINTPPKLQYDPGNSLIALLQEANTFFYCTVLYFWESFETLTIFFFFSYIQIYICIVKNKTVLVHLQFYFYFYYISYLKGLQKSPTFLINATIKSKHSSESKHKDTSLPTELIHCHCKVEACGQSCVCLKRTTTVTVQRQPLTAGTTSPPSQQHACNMAEQRDTQIHATVLACKQLIHLSLTG